MDLVTPTLLGVGGNVTAVTQNLQKVKYSTPGHMGTKGQSWIRTQERPPRGLSLAHTTRLRPWTAWHTCQQLGARKPEVCAAPRVGGLEPGQASAAEGAGVRMGTGLQGIPPFPSLVCLLDSSESTRGLPWDAPQMPSSCYNVSALALSCSHPVAGCLWNQLSSLCTSLFPVGKSKSPWCLVLTSRQSSVLDSSAFPAPNPRSST